MRARDLDSRPMGTADACGICSGALELRIAGTAGAVTADLFAPSLHEPGRHGDLFELPRVRHGPAAGAAAGRRPPRAVPRDERRRATWPRRPGRRATARRLLDLIGAAGARRARCSTSAAATACCSTRRAGAATTSVGLELSRAAAAPRPRRRSASTCARCRSRTSTQAASGFDAIVLADVIEHLDDPVGGARPLPRAAAPRRRAVRRHARPVVADRARWPGARWWGFLPAHMCLLPARARCASC